MPQPEPPAFSRTASAYHAAIVAAAVAAVLAAVVARGPGSRDWALFAVVLAGAVVAQRSSVRPRAYASVRTTGAFVVTAAVVLPPDLVAAAVVVSYLPVWGRCRDGLRPELFNVADMTAAGLAAWAAFHAAGGAGASGSKLAAAGAAACATLVLVNHGALAVMLRLVRGGRLVDSPFLAPDALATSACIAATGVGAAAAWAAEPWAIPFAYVPLLLVHRGFTIPHLEEEAALDAKTRLYNARHFSDAIVELVDRAARVRRPLAVLMVDLDFLRDINNAHGHLAGDAVLTGVADAIRENIREGDVAARFGGEEFAIILPGTAHADAIEIARRIRRAVEEREFRAETSATAIRATVSVGVACYPFDADNARALVHAADVGLYRAKDEGRNRVVYAGAAATA